MVLSIALFMGMLYQYFSDQLMSELETETWLVAQGVELNGMDYLTGLNTENRVTWVDQDGTVLYDSQADAGSMENHADREEIQQALTASPAPPGATLLPWLSRLCMRPAAWMTGPSSAWPAPSRRW